MKLFIIGLVGDKGCIMNLNNNVCQDYRLESSSNDHIADLFVWIKNDYDILDDEISYCESTALEFINNNKSFYKDYEKVYLHFIQVDGYDDEELCMIPFDLP